MLILDKFRVYKFVGIYAILKFWLAVWRSAGMPRTGVLHALMVKTRNSYHYAIRKAKKEADFVRAKKLFEASESSCLDLLHELKCIRAGNKAVVDLPDIVAGANGESEIVAKFRDVYRKLYNTWGSQVEMVEVKNKISSLLDTENSAAEVQKLTGSIVKQAVCKMKPGKSDVTGAFNSDALLHAPDSLFEILALVYRSWLFH